MRRPVALVTVAVVLATAACSGGSSAHPKPANPHASARPATLPGLAPAWKVTLPAGSEPVQHDLLDTPTQGDLTVWETGQMVVVVGVHSVTALDSATGKAAWTWAVPHELGRVCGATAPNENGLAALLFAPHGGCRAVGLFDATSGQLRWHADLGDTVASRRNSQLAWVGSHTVVVPTFCGPARVFSLRSGRALPNLPAGGSLSSCEYTTRVRDGLLAVLHERTSSHPTLSLIDLASGHTRWTAREPIHSRLEGLVSTDPLVIDTSTGSGQVFRSYDDHGRPGPYIGYRTMEQPKIQGVLDGVLVLSYDVTSVLSRAARYYGFDVATGKQLWSVVPDEADVLGRTGNQLLLAGTSSAGVNGLADEAVGSGPNTTFVLGRTSASDPAQQAGLGTVTVAGSWNVDFDLGWTSDLILVQTTNSNRLTAYRIPRNPRQALPHAVSPKPAWARGDLTSDLGLCQRVRRSTLSVLGIPRDYLPPPADCSWLALSPTTAYSNYVSVETYLLQPRGKQTASEVAHGQLERFLSDDKHGPNHVGPTSPIQTAGDEAFIASADGTHTREVRMLARYHNLVVILTVLIEAITPRDSPPPVARLTRGEVRALGDLVKAATS